MNRREALKTLGLGEDATPEDIHEAYRECAQILHPDRFAGNKKLQERATEQFKHMQEAYEYLTKGFGKSRKSTKSAPASSRPGSWRTNENGVEVEYITVTEIKARLAGISAARTQLVAQLDVLYDRRRNSLIMAVIGAIAVAITIRRPFGLFGIIAAIGSAAVVYGIVQAWSTHKNIRVLEQHLNELKKEQKEYEALLAQCEKQEKGKS
ncbi:MAG: J domain-containing protein [Eggerthellaceae bacterium]|nr:J domain-containing protein [Eggerthellaceae bacterium]